MRLLKFPVVEELEEGQYGKKEERASFMGWLERRKNALNEKNNRKFQFLICFSPKIPYTLYIRNNVNFRGE